MKKEPLKVGERVKCYAPDLRLSGSPGEVTWVAHKESALSVRMDNSDLGTRTFHTKQVRRLRPRKKAEKPERVRWRMISASWHDINGGAQRSLNGVIAGDNEKPNFTMIEIRPGEIPLSQKDLWTALRTKHGIPRPTCHEILDQLGFPKEAQ